jgi:hypothetical protein
VVHLVTDTAMAAGRYAALCGCEVIAASLTAPDRHHCRTCRDRAADR